MRAGQRFLSRLRVRQASAFAGAAIAASAVAQPALIPIDDARLQRAGVNFEAVTARPQTAARMLLPGTAVFSSNALEQVSAPAAGVVQALLVQPMQPLAAGAPVIRLHSPQVLEWQREYVQAQAQLAMMADKLARDQALFKEGIIARSRLEETTSAHTHAQATVQEHRQLLRLAGMSEAALGRLTKPSALSPELTLVSRHAGTVVEQTVNVGQRVEAGAPLLRIARGGELLLELQASREQAEQVAVGDAVKVAGCAGSGRIVAKSPQLSPSNQLLSLRASFAGLDKCVRANQHVQAELALAAGTASAASVPAAAVLRHEGREYVMLREKGGVRPVPVKSAGGDGQRVLVTGNLPDKAMVAVSGTALLKGVWLGLGSEPAPAR